MAAPGERTGIALLCSVSSGGGSDDLEDDIEKPDSQVRRIKRGEDVDMQEGGESSVDDILPVRSDVGFGSYEGDPLSVFSR